MTNPPEVKKSIAVLMTCHNRRETTKACLLSLKHQEGICHDELKIYLLDAGSTDGTVEMIRDLFPSVVLICRDDSYFWCSGMRVVFSAAMDAVHDYYLWLNDDTLLFPEALKKMLLADRQVEAKTGRQGIIIGSTCDVNHKKRTYGGLVVSRKQRPLSFSPAEVTDELVRCDAMNGNCVLIPQRVAHSVGTLSKEFTHAMGDIDYGFRARKQGYLLWLAPGFIGTCESNSTPSWSNACVPLSQRIKALASPKGIPLKEWYVFTRRHSGKYWPIYWIKVPLRALFPFL